MQSKRRSEFGSYGACNYNTSTLHCCKRCCLANNPTHTFTFVRRHDPCSQSIVYMRSGTALIINALVKQSFLSVKPRQQQLHICSHKMVSTDLTPFSIVYSAATTIDNRGGFTPFSIVHTATTTSNNRRAFPGLIPGLAGSLPGHTPPMAVKTDVQPSTPSSMTEPGTNERLERLEALVLQNADDIQSLKRYNSAVRHENDSLRMRLSELEYLATKSPQSFASPASAIDYLAKHRQEHPGYQSPAPAGKRRPRFLP